MNTDTFSSGSTVKNHIHYLFSDTVQHGELRSDGGS